MERDLEQQRPGEIRQEQAARPLAALWFVILAMIALLLPILNGSAWAELALGRRPADSRVDPGLMRLSPLILPSTDHLRKAQSLKLQPTKWIPGGGDAVLPSAAAGTHAVQPRSTPELPVSVPVLNSGPFKTHPPRAPPALLFPL